MNQRIDSFKKVMALEEVEQVPVIPSVSGWVAKFSGVPLKDLFVDPKAIARAQIRAQQTIGYDALFAQVDALCLPEAFGCPLVFRSSGPDVESIALQNEEEVEGLRCPDVHRDGRFPVLLNVAEHLVNLTGRKVPVLSLTEGPFTISSRILGAERMLRALIKQRPMVEKMLEKVSQTLSHFVDALSEAGIDGLIIADPVSSSTMISPAFYRQYVLPYLKPLVGGWKVPVILHVCGDTRPILHLMAETGAKILSLDQCMDLAKAKEMLGGRCGIGGNVDPVQILLFGTPQDVERDTLRCLGQGGKKGFILMAGCGVPPDTPAENLITMVKVAKGK